MKRLYILFFILLVNSLTSQNNTPDCLVDGECLEIAFTASGDFKFSSSGGNRNYRYWIDSGSGFSGAGTPATSTEIGDPFDINVNSGDKLRIKDVTAEGILTPSFIDNLGEALDGNFSIEDWGDQPYDSFKFTRITFEMNSTEAPFFQSSSSAGDGGVLSIESAFERSIITGTGNWDWGTRTSQIERFVGAFLRNTTFNEDISNWDVSSGTDFRQMFDVAQQFDQDLSTWNMANATEMGNMFNRASNFNNAGQPLNWNVGKCINFGNMFRLTPFNNGEGAGASNRPLDWNIGEFTGTALIDMNNMFNQAVNFNQPLPWEDTDRSMQFVSNLSAMFSGATNFNQDLSSWNVSSVNNFSSMFSGASVFNNGGNTDLSWDANIGSAATVSTINMSNMFSSADQFSADITGWNTDKVTNFSRMFLNAVSFNQDISSWNMSNATNMTEAFDFSAITLGTYESILASWASNPFANTSLTIGVKELIYCEESNRNSVQGTGITFDGDGRTCLPGGVTTSVLSYYSAQLNTPFGSANSTIINQVGDVGTFNQTGARTVVNQTPTATGEFNFQNRFDFDGIQDHYGNLDPFVTDGEITFIAVGQHTAQNNSTINTFKPLISSANNLSIPFDGYEIKISQNSPSIEFTVPSDATGTNSTITETTYTEAPAFFGLVSNYAANEISAKAYFNDISPTFTSTFTNPFSTDIQLSGRVGDNSTDGNGSFYKGGIGEVLIYSRALSENEINKIKSSLSIKYGFTLNTLDYIDSDNNTFWTQDTGFNTRIFGVAKDIGAGIDQKVSKSTNQGGNLVVSTSSDYSSANVEPTRVAVINDKSFVIFADNNATLGNSTNENFGGINVSTTDRVWKVQDTNSDDCVSMNFDVSAYSFNSYTGDLVALIDNDPAFSTPKIIRLSEIAANTNYELKYNFGTGSSYMKIGRINSADQVDFTGTEDIMGISTQTSLDITSSSSPNTYLTLKSRTGGLVFPSMTTAERTALTEVPGMVVYNIETNVLEYTDGTTDNWIVVSPDLSLGSPCQ